MDLATSPQTTTEDLSINSAILEGLCDIRKTFSNNSQSLSAALDALAVLPIQ